MVVAVSPETASESVVDLAPRNFSRTAEPMETPATVFAVFIVVAAVAEYRGACVGLDAVGACLAAAQCSVIDENELGGPATCGDAIAGRVYSV